MEEIEIILEEGPKRTLVVGDVHSAYKALVQVLQRCEFDPEEDQLIFLGDYIDGWSENVETIEYLINLEDMCKYKPVFLCGNHCLLMRDWLNTGKSDIIWEQNGGDKTKEEYIKKGFLTNQIHKDFFNSLHFYHEDGLGRLFIHAGIKKIDELTNVSIQNLCKDRTMWEKHAMIGVYNEPMKAYKEIYIGHTPTINWNIKPHYPEYEYSRQEGNGPITVPMNRCNVWNVDTGAGWNGKLTVMDVDTKEYWQSDNVQELYPNEKGRFK